MKFEPEPERDAQVKPLKRLYRRIPRRIRLAVMSLLVVSIIIGVSYSMYQFNNWSKQWELKFQVPIQNFIRIEPRVTAQRHHFIAVAEASEGSPTPPPLLTGCEKYREFVQPIFGQYTDQALFVAGKESRGCTVNISDKANRNGTWDYCIFAINNEPSTRYNLDKCIQRAWDKFSASGFTWRQWYAVCPLGGASRYPGIIKCK